MGMEVEEGHLLRKMEKKSKKNKRNRANALEELSDCRDAMHKREKDSVKLSKEEKKKKNKEKHEPCDDIEFNLKQNEAKNVEDYVEVDISNNEEKDQKKKKKRKLEVDKNEKECVNVKKKHKRTGNDGEAIEIKEASHRKIHAGGEENRGLRMNDSEDLGSDFELEARKAKKRKHKKNRNKDGIDAVSSSMEILEDNKMGKDKITMGRNKFEKENIAEMKNVEEGNKKKKKKKGTRDKEGSDVKGKKSRKDVDQSTVLSENRKSKGTSKRVSFSGHVEVFPLSNGPNHGEDQVEGLVRGKRFSREEDEMVKEAVSNYIEEHALGEEGLDMILHCKSHSELRNCWREIGASLPWRPLQSIYYRAHILFERAENRAWTSEEYEIVRRFHEKHGSDWKMLADAMGKHRFHVKDTWRRIKLPNLKKGHWSQEEYQTLFDLVNMDLRMKASEEKKSKHGMLRDNICWEAISDKLSTRINASCCQKWYNQLTSSMVAGGEWADADDYRLIDVLFSLDACCMEDVDWDCLLEHRSGDVCRKRWNQMVKHIGERGNKSFAEQVEILSKRYCLDVLEAREAYDSKPAVP